MLLRLLRSQGGVDMWMVIMYILSTLLTIFLILPIHECAHALVASKLGDNTAKRMGRITLNPLAHIDYMGAALMLIIGFGWAKPVPVDPWKFKNPKRGMAVVALAGPVSNLLAAIVGGLVDNGIALALYKGAISYGPFIYYVEWFLMFFIMINIGLAVFNFIPIPPLDGSKILMAFLPDRAVDWINERQQFLSMALMIVIIMGGLNGILNTASTFLFDCIMKLTGLPFSWAY